MVTDPESVLAPYKDVMPAGVKAELLKEVRRRLTPTQLRIRCEVEVTCFTYEGIDSIKAAIKAAEAACADDELPVKCKLVSPPIYVLQTTSLNQDAGVASVHKATDVLKAEIERLGGSLTIKVPAKSISETEDDFNARLAALELANREVAADDDDEE